MKDKPNPATFVGALIGLAGLGAQHWPSTICIVCKKPVESGTAYRDIKGFGKCHPQCDPREKKGAAK